MLPNITVNLIKRELSNPCGINISAYILLLYNKFISVILLYQITVLISSLLTDVKIKIKSMIRDKSVKISSWRYNVIFISPADLDKVEFV